MMPQLRRRADRSSSSTESLTGSGVAASHTTMTAQHIPGMLSRGMSSGSWQCTWWSGRCSSALEVPLAPGNSMPAQYVDCPSDAAGGLPACLACMLGRGGYYPGLFFPELAKITAEFLPSMEAAYYIHNFKGTRPGISADIAALQHSNAAHSVSCDRACWSNLSATVTGCL
jgi:hypothetical protein